MHGLPATAPTSWPAALRNYQLAAGSVRRAWADPAGRRAKSGSHAASAVNSSSTIARICFEREQGACQRVEHHRVVDVFPVSGKCRLDRQFLNIDVRPVDRGALGRQRPDRGRLDAVAIDEAGRLRRSTRRAGWGSARGWGRCRRSPGDGPSPCRTTIWAPYSTEGASSAFSLASSSSRSPRLVMGGADLVVVPSLRDVSTRSAPASLRK